MTIGIGCSITRECSIVAIWQLLHCRVGTNKLMSFVVKILSNDAPCIACIIGQVLLELNHPHCSHLCAIV